MVSKSDGTKLWTYTYDHENRLGRAAERRQNVTYKYDALGRRVERNKGYGIERSKFTHDGQDVLVENTNSTTIKYQNGPGIDNKLSVKQGTTTNYFLADHLGSTMGTTGPTGVFTAAPRPDSFGNGSADFTGREYDSFTELQYSRARWYDPNLGRFTSEDPIGFEGGDVNLYGYVRNNPINFIDPTGTTVVIKLLKAVRTRGKLFFVDTGKRLSTRQAQNVRKHEGDIKVEGSGRRKAAERIEHGANPDGEVLNHGPHGDPDMFDPHYQTQGKDGHTFYGGAVAIFAPNVISLSDNPCTTNGQMISAFLWDGVGLIDPIGVTDALDAYTGLDGGRGGLGGMADFGIELTSPLLPPLGMTKSLY